MVMVVALLAEHLISIVLLFQLVALFRLVRVADALEDVYRKAPDFAQHAVLMPVLAADVLSKFR